MSGLLAFVRESNRIEGIIREPLQCEIEAHEKLLGSDDLDVNDMELFVSVIAPDKLLRRKATMNVRVGSHIAPQGGGNIVRELDDILTDARDNAMHPYLIHQRYETLHPFMDGNGRSGRALWLWMMARNDALDHALALGFLHAWYYQSLSVGRPSTPLKGR